MQQVEINTQKLNTRTDGDDSLVDLMMNKSRIAVKYCSLTRIQLVAIFQSFLHTFYINCSLETLLSVERNYQQPLSNHCSINC